ncbi:MAG: fasciclin domain-containing protein [Chloroflexota bacterium]
MLKPILLRVMTAMLIALASIIGTSAVMENWQSAHAAPVAKNLQQDDSAESNESEEEAEENTGPISLRSNAVKGRIGGGQFAKIWLGLEPASYGATIRVFTEWDRVDPLNNGVGFYILSEENLKQVLSGTQVRDAHISAGSPVFEGQSNQLDESFQASGLSNYTLVIFNDSNTDANFTINITDGFITDESGQVQDTSVTEEEAESEATEEAAEEVAEDAVATTAPAAPAASVAAPAAAVPAPAAAAPPTAVPAAPTAVPVAAAPTAAPAPTNTPEPAPTEAAVQVVEEGVIQAKELTGELAQQFSQHFYILEPSIADGNIRITMQFEPQDNSELARRMNFWVMNEEGFRRFIDPTNPINPSDVAIAAGSRAFRGTSNERIGNFKSVGLSQYRLIIYNNASIAGTYSVRVDGGIITDDSGNSNESKTTEETADEGETETAETAPTTAPVAAAPVAAAPAAAVPVAAAPAPVAAAPVAAAPVAAAPAPVAAAPAPAPTATPVPAPAPAAQAAPAASASGSIAPGSTYTVKSGDTLALIAIEAFGNYQRYEEICAFNGLTNCNVIEVGDELNIPTLAQVSAGIDAPATGSANVAEEEEPTPRPVRRPTATPEPEEEVVEEAVVEEEAVEEEIAEDDGDSAGTPVLDIIDTAVAAGNFKNLVTALEAAEIADTLRGPGPFTVFAPTDAAFDALPAGALDQLLANPGGQLTQILRYHVLLSDVKSGDLAEGLEIETLQGANVFFEVSDSFTLINGANISAVDIETTNGVIHVIDAVILPPIE